MWALGNMGTGRVPKRLSSSWRPTLIRLTILSCSCSPVLVPAWLNRRCHIALCTRIVTVTISVITFAPILFLLVYIMPS